MKEAAAADYVGCSVRSLANYKKKGWITPTKVRSDKSRPVDDYAETDLQKLKSRLLGLDEIGEMHVAETEGPKVAETAIVKASFNPLAEAQRIEFAPGEAPQWAMELMAKLGGSQKAAEKPPVPLKDKFLLTLEEARQLSGLSVERLREAAAGGWMAATKEGRGWKVRPQALEDYCEMLVPSKQQVA